MPELRDRLTLLVDPKATSGTRMKVVCTPGACGFTITLTGAGIVHMEGRQTGEYSSSRAGARVSFEMELPHEDAIRSPDGKVQALHFVVDPGTETGDVVKIECGEGRFGEFEFELMADGTVRLTGDAGQYVSRPNARVDLKVEPEPDHKPVATIAPRPALPAPPRSLGSTSTGTVPRVPTGGTGTGFPRTDEPGLDSLRPGGGAGKGA